jgi:hypothetical protein
MNALIGDETDITDHLKNPIKIGDIVVCSILCGQSSYMETGMVLSCRETEKQITLRVGFRTSTYGGKTHIYDHKYRVEKRDKNADRVTVVTSIIDPMHTIFDMKAYIG